jgi:hypothetical protein
MSIIQVHVQSAIAKKTHVALRTDGYLNESTYLGEGETVNEYFDCIDILENDGTSVSPIIDGMDSYSGATKDHVLSDYTSACSERHR